MDPMQRLQILSAQMDLELDKEADSGGLPRSRKDSLCVSTAQRNGQPMYLFKTLLTSACERNCYYCPFRAGRDLRRATFSPEEFAQTFMKLHQKRIADGLFISSGVVSGGCHTQDKLIDTAEILRHKLGYRGYLHLKLMPGAQKSQVERAMQLADRISVNLEAPNTKRLLKLAPRKQFLEELLEPLRWVDEIRQNQPSYKGWNGRWPSSTTQFVVGAVGDSDLELLQTTEQLHNQVHLRRAYFSAFNPIPDTPLENQPATNPLRQHRLYQASYLLRDYGFSLEDMPFETGDQNLPLDVDPKLAWAKTHLYEPLEINRADRTELLRIPGIGPITAERILKLRREGKLHDASSLTKLGIVVKRAAPYILLDGHRPAHQMSLF